MARRIRAATLAVVVAGSLLLTPTSSLADTSLSASGLERVYAETVKVAADGEIREHARVTVTAAMSGQRFGIYGRFNVRQPNARMMLELRMTCTGDEVQEVTTRNTRAGADTVLIGRWVFVAPTRGAHVCRLTSRSTIPGRFLNPNAVLTIDGADSYIEATGPADRRPREAARFDDVYIPVGTAADVGTRTWTAPSDVSTFRVAGDIQYTNCYDGGGAAACNTAPSNRRSSVISTALQVMQIATDGGYCNIVGAPAEGLRLTEITRDVHHLKVYHRVDEVPVSTADNCTRDFRIKVYTRVESGNPVVAHGGRYSQKFIYPTVRPVVVEPAAPEGPAIHPSSVFNPARTRLVHFLRD